MLRKWKDVKVLPVLVSFLFVLLLSAGAQAFSYSNKTFSYSNKSDSSKSKDSGHTSGHNFSLSSIVFKVSFNGRGDKDDWDDKKGDDHKKFKDLLTKFKNFKWHPKQTTHQPVPEPSAALVFGVGLLVASQVRRRKS